MVFKGLLAAAAGVLGTLFSGATPAGSSSATCLTVTPCTSNTRATTTVPNLYNKNISPRAADEYSYYRHAVKSSSFNPSALVTTTGNQESVFLVPHKTTGAAEMPQETNDHYPYRNSHLPITSPGPIGTNEHDATETSELHTQPSDTIDPFSGNFPHDAPTIEREICTYNMSNNYCPEPTDDILHGHKIPTIKKTDVTSIQPLTTLVTVMRTHGTLTTVTPTPTPISTIAGCRTVADCPRCSPFTQCHIGKLSPFCVGNPIKLHEKSPDLWQNCREELKNISREERKAWAVQITPSHCVKIDEWDPKDIDYDHGGICRQIVHGWGKEPEARAAWISGLLPIQCPFGSGDGPGDWHRFPTAIRKGCKNAAKVLNKPFIHEPHWGGVGKV